MSLSPRTIEVCKLTAPVIAKYSETVSTKLYEKLYENDPDTIRLFGSTQKKQSKHFSSTIIFCLDHIDNLDTATKKVSTLKTSKYNSIIKTSLIQALEDVFGDAATSEVIEAWEEVYSFMDDIVIANEKELYAS